MVTKCHQCGKKTVIPWPQYWAYRRGQMFFCSWSCLRKFDKEIKWEIIMNKRGHLKPEEVQTAINIVKAGKSPFQYLRSIGIKDPQQSWYKIKRKIMEQDPDLYDELPAKLPPEKSEQKPKVDKGMPKPKDAPPVVKVSGPIVIETPEDGAVKIVNDVKKLDEATKPKITKPLNFAGLEVTAVMDTEFGEFHFDHKYNTIDWRTLDGEEVCLNPTGWKNLAARLPEIMGVLGVQV